MQTLLPGIAATSRAPHKVWSGSLVGPVRCSPRPRDQIKGWRVKLKGLLPRSLRGVSKLVLMEVWGVLAFAPDDGSGRLVLSHATIAGMAEKSVRTIKSALAVLRDQGVIEWDRRCRVEKDEQGRTRLRQLTNSYRMLPPSRWLGYVDRDGPPPEPGTWGDHPPLPDDPVVENVLRTPAGFTGVQSLPRETISINIEDRPPADLDHEQLKAWHLLRFQKHLDSG